MVKKVLLLFNKNYDSIFGLLLILFSFGSLAFIPIKLAPLSSVFHYLILLFLMIWFIFKIVFSISFYFKNKTERHFLNYKNIVVFLGLLTVLFTGFILLITVNFKIPNLTFLTKFFIFSEVVITISFFSTSKFSTSLIKLASILSMFFIILLFALWVSGNASNYIGVINKLLTFNYSNPNVAGLVIFTLSFISVTGLFYFKRIYLKICSALVTTLGVLLYILTAARSAAIAFILSIIFYFIYFLCKKRKKFFTFSFVFCLFPLIFAICYFLFYASALPNGVYVETSDFVFFGKNLGSRYVVWRDAFYSISNIKNLLFGVYSQKAGNIGAFHYHNGILDPLVSYGIFSFVLLIFFLVFTIYYLLKENVSNLKSNCLGVIMLFFVFLLGISESSPFYSSNGIYILWFISILVIRFPEGACIFEKYEKRKLTVDDKADVLIITSVYGVGSIGKIVQSLHNYYLLKNINSFVVHGRGNQSRDKNTFAIENMFEVFISKLLRRIFKKQWIGNYFMTKEIIYLIKNISPKVVHIHALNDDFVNYKMLLAFLAKKKIKVVYTNHSEWMYLGNCGGYSFNCNKFISGCDNCKFKNSAKTLRLKETLFGAFDRSNLIITSVSPWVNNRSKKSLVFKNFRNFCVLNCNDIAGYSRNLYKKDFLAKYKLDTSKKIVLNVTPSLASPIKGFRYYHELARLNPDIDFIVLSYLVDANFDHLDNLFVFKNITDKKELANFYFNCDLLVITSEKETFSMPVSEALSCGLPVIGFRAGGPESIALDNYCKFVEFSDVVSLNTLLHDTIKQKFDKQKIIKEAEEKYSVEIIGDEYLKIYKLFYNDDTCFGKKIWNLTL